MKKKYKQLLFFFKHQNSSNIKLFSILYSLALEYFRSKRITISAEEKIFLKGQSGNIIKLIPLIIISLIPIPIPITPFLILLGKKIGIDLIPKNLKIPKKD